MIKLAAPIVAGMLGQMLIGITDTIMVGHVGIVPLAASAFVNSLVHLPLVFSIGLLSSISVLASQAYGAKRPTEAGEVLQHGLILAMILGLLTVAFSVVALPFLGWLGQPPEVISACKNYLVLFGVSMLPALIAIAGKQFSESMEHPWAPSLIMLGTVALNALLNWVLIYGNWGAPALGLDGAGWATLIARTVLAIVTLGYVIYSPALRTFQPLKWWSALSRARLYQLFTLGWPVALQHLLEVSAFVFAALMMGWINAEAIAAHQVAITCAASTFMFALGIGMAACIRVGHAYGAGQHQRMRRIGFIGISLAAVVMGIFALVFVLTGKPLAQLFLTSEPVIVLTAQLLLVAAVFQIVDGTQVAAICALRGLSDVRVPAMIAVLAYWTLAVPIAYWLGFTLRLGAVGIWIGLAIGLATAAVLLTWRFHLKTIQQAPESSSA